MSVIESLGRLFDQWSNYVNWIIWVVESVFSLYVINTKADYRKVSFTCVLYVSWHAYSLDIELFS